MAKFPLRRLCGWPPDDCVKLLEGDTVQSDAAATPNTASPAIRNIQLRM